MKTCEPIQTASLAWEVIAACSTLFLFYRQQQILGLEDQARPAADDMLVASLPEILPDLDAGSTEQLRDMLANTSAAPDLLMEPFLQCPTLIQASLLCPLYCKILTVPGTDRG